MCVREDLRTVSLDGISLGDQRALFGAELVRRIRQGVEGRFATERRLTDEASGPSGI